MKSLPLLAGLLALLLLTAPLNAAQPPPPSKIAPEVQAALQRGERTPLLIVLREQADLSGADALPTKQAKGRFVFEQLREVAARTQAPLRAELDRRGIPYRAYYIVNLIAVETADAALVQQLAARPEVERIAGNPAVQLQDPVSRAPGGEASNAVEWGVAKIGAPDVWQMGFKGQGIVVANQDTGVQWNHPALKKNYRGWDKNAKQADHSYNWWDAIHADIDGNDDNEPNPCGYNSKKPCDDDDHGTHTMGTVAGRTQDNQIGVAYKAKWIACRNMDLGTGRPSTYIECFEFFLAPWDKNGNSPNPDLAPDVVSNSWGCPLGPPKSGGEDCVPNSLKAATRSLRAAGIFLAVSAGNTGSSCSTISDPSAIYNESTTIGATNSRDQLASFSSRGPVTVDGSNRRKPDISAPGVSVRSSVRGNTYAVFSGTSMAAPHVAGAVALLWNARPALRGDINATVKALFNSAFTNVSAFGTCGGTGASDIPNNLFGYGRLDVLAAVNSIGP